MAKDKFSATPVKVVDTTVPGDDVTERINSVSFLPRYLQTSQNKKFLNVTLDPLISKGSAEDINAYVGRKSGTVYRPATDPYLAETRPEREQYQFDVGAVAKDADGNITHSIAYADILQQYKQQYPAFKPSDLDASYYSWQPPIDVDKFVNFSNYYWFSQGLPAIEISGDIDVRKEILNHAVYTSPVQANGKRVQFRNGMKVFFTNNTLADSEFVSTIITSQNLDLYCNGIRFTFGQDYSVTGSMLSIDSSFAKLPSDKIVIRKWNQVNPVPFTYQTILANAQGTATFTVDSSLSYDVTVNGLALIKNVDYTVSGSTVQLTGLKANDSVQVRGWNSVQIDGSALAAFTETNLPITQAAQSAFSITGGYTVGSVDLYLNGLQLINGVDYVAENGSTITILNSDISLDSTLTLRKWNIAFKDINVPTQTPGDIDLGVIGNVEVKYFTVEGVGRDIVLLSQASTDPLVRYSLNLPEGWDTMGWDSTPWDATTYGNPNPEYVVMGRGASNRNAWSRINQWHHTETIQAVLDYLGQDYASYLTADIRGRRSIIEFNSNLELLNHGRQAKASVNVVADNINLNTVIGAATAMIDGVTLKDNFRILVINTPGVKNNKIFTVIGVGDSIQLLAASDAIPHNNETILVRSGSVYKAVEFYYSESNATWVKAQQKTKRNQAPLFTLYDSSGIILSNQTVYKNNNFTGNTLFQYKSGSFADSVLGFGIEYEDTSYDILNNASPYAKNFTNIKFTWTQNTPDLYYETATGRAPIPGDYYFKTFDKNNNYSLSNGWIHNSQEALTTQRLTHVVKDVAGSNSLVIPADFWPSYDYVAYLENGQLFFNIVSKSGAPAQWDPTSNHLVLPIGRTATIRNLTGTVFTIEDKSGSLFGSVNNNGSTGNLDINVYSNDIDSNEFGGHFVYLVTEFGRFPVQIIDPATDSRSLTVRVNGKKLQPSDYVLDLQPMGYWLTITDIAVNDVIEALFVSKQEVGVYSTHSTMEANAANASVYETSYSKIFEHCISTISAQPNISGTPYGLNSYGNSARLPGMGYVMQQQNASSLLPGLLAAGGIDTSIVLSKAGETYASFRNKFINKLIQINKQVDTDAILSRDLVDLVLTQMNVGKNSSFPHAYSDMVLWNTHTVKSYTATGATSTFAHGTTYKPSAQFNNRICVYVNGVITPAELTETSVILGMQPELNDVVEIRVYNRDQLSFVPPSLAKLGITNPWVPEILTDNTRGERNYIKCHDGAEITVFEENYINHAIMEFELRAFAGIPVPQLAEDKNILLSQNPPFSDEELIITRNEQVLFTVAGGYEPGKVDLYLNGVQLIQESDYSASTGTSVTVNSQNLMTSDKLVLRKWNADFVDSVQSISDATQTVFNVAGGYTVDKIDVHLNGLMLLPTVDYTATDGTTITLTNSVVTQINDVLSIRNWDIGTMYSSAVVPVTSAAMTTFSVVNTSKGKVDVHLNGVLLLDGIDFAISSSTVTLNDNVPALEAGDSVTYRVWDLVEVNSAIDNGGPLVKFAKDRINRLNEPGAYRKSQYTIEEKNAFLEQFYRKWAVSNGITSYANVGYDANNPFTWNYSDPGTIVDGGGGSGGTLFSVTSFTPATVTTTVPFTEVNLTVAQDNQTVFNVPGGYEAGTIDVYMNGLQLVSGIDYLANDGTTITINGAAIKLSYKLTVRKWNVVFENAVISVQSANQRIFQAPAGFTSVNSDLYVNGVKFTEGVDYTVSGSTITMDANVSLKVTDKLLARQWLPVNENPYFNFTLTVGTDGTTSFTASYEYNYDDVTVNGVTWIKDVDYQVTSDNTSRLANLRPTDLVQVRRWDVIIPTTNTGDGKSIGSWHGIYIRLFDTDRPDIAPWEMLGYNIKPTWWDTHYSWTDTVKRIKLESALRGGIVSQPGAPKTIRPQYARKGAIFPVTATGELMDPVAAGIAQAPAPEVASRAWKFGEWGDQELIWRKSASYQWAEAAWQFATRPNLFISQNFDPFDQINVATKFTVVSDYITLTNAVAQTVNKSAGKRIGVGSLVLHRENGAQCLGLNQLISEYIVSQNKDLASDYYDVVHYGGIQMMHKIGGYADKRTLAYKADTLKQSLGSNFIPEENFSLQLYTGAPYSSLFYSGVKVTFTGNGYEVTGYDKVKNYFLVYKPKAGSRNKASTYSNITVIDALDYETTPSVVDYGTVFATRQEVYNFFTGLNRAMIDQGFVFDQYDPNQSGILDFKMSGKQFMFWSASTWTPGNFIALSPLSDAVKFYHGHGWIVDYNSLTDYEPVVDLEERKIAIADLDFDRTQDGWLTVSSRVTDKGIYGLAINVSEIEHAAVFDNTTTFGDVVYNPLYRLKQYRLKYSGQRTKDWNGTPYAPGYFLNGNKIIGNFDRTISDIASRYYSVEGTTQNSRLVDTARHSVGVESAGALADIIENSTTQFEFERAALRQKGTPAAYAKLLRSSAVEASSDALLADEEWMFKLSEFGNVNSIQAWEFALRHEDFKESKQLIRFTRDYTYNSDTGAWTKNIDDKSDRAIDLPSDDSRWIYKPESGTNFAFAMRPHSVNLAEINYSQDVQNAGYAFADQADLTAENIDDIAALYSSMKDSALQYQYKIWVADYTSKIDGLNSSRFTGQSVPAGWNMLVQQDIPLSISRVYLADETKPTEPAHIEFAAAHNLAVGTIIIVLNASYVSGIHVVQSVVDATTITVDSIVTTDITTGTAMSFMPVRFSNTNDSSAALASTKYAWRTGDTVYVDNVQGSYTVYTVQVTDDGVTTETTTTASYVEQDTTDADTIKSIVLYDKQTNRKLAELDIYDPAKGYIPRAAARDIDIRSSYDPAIYSATTDTEVTTSEVNAWGAQQEGTVWWDLSTSKFLAYEQGSLEYRHNNWGRLFEGASIDVYQWIGSSVDPVTYNQASIAGKPIDDVVPVGLARVESIDSTDVYSYSTEETVNRDGTVVVTYYYWVKGLDTVSNARPEKKLSVTAIAQAISDPDSMSIAWAAPVSETAMIVSNIIPYLNNTSTSLQIQTSAKEEDNLGIKPEVHSQWMLLRENDSVNQIPEWLHNRLRDSLAGFDRNAEIYSYTDYDSAFLYPQGSIFRQVVDSTVSYYRASRDFAAADLTLPFPSAATAAAYPIVKTKPVHKLYDYEILPPGVDGLGRIKVQKRKDVPDARLSEGDRYGNRIRPTQQTWIQNRDSARRTFIASANKLLATMDLFEAVPNWSKHLTQVTSGALQYNISNFYTIVDYVNPAYSTLKPVAKTYALETDIVLSEIADNSYILVTNASKYAIYLISGSERVLMYKKNATIQFTEDLFNSLKKQYSWDIAPWDFTAWDSDPGVEFGEIVTALREDIFVGDYSVLYNKLFFDMVRYIFSENENVTWIAKSSYLYIDNLDVDSLVEKPYLVEDKVEKYIDYINEVKPYRTKVRQVIDTRNAMDIVSTTVTDTLEIDVVTKYPATNQQFTFRIVADGTGTQYYRVVGTTLIALPAPLNTNLTFNDPGKTLLESTNSGAQAIVQN